MKENGYDVIKNMLNISRKNKINENYYDDEQPQTTTLTDAELDDEIKSFKEAVGGVVSFDEFIVMEGDIKWSGKLDNENIYWYFSLSSANGCGIRTEKAILSDESLDRLIKLQSYYKVWSNYWSKEVNG